MRQRRVFILLFADPVGIGFAFHRTEDAEKQNNITLQVEKLFELLAISNTVYCYYRTDFIEAESIFHRRPLNGDGKYIQLCDLCASSPAFQRDGR